MLEDFRLLPQVFLFTNVVHKFFCVLNCPTGPRSENASRSFHRHLAIVWLMLSPSKCPHAHSLSHRHAVRQSQDPHSTAFEQNITPSESVLLLLKNLTTTTLGAGSAPLHRILPSQKSHRTDHSRHAWTLTLRSSCSNQRSRRRK